MFFIIVIIIVPVVIGLISIGFLFAEEKTTANELKQKLITDNNNNSNTNSTTTSTTIKSDSLTISEIFLQLKDPEIRRKLIGIIIIL